MDVDKENRPNGGKTASSYQVPWIEKYRPQKLEEVVGNEETLVRLQAIAEDGNLPNLILCGPPGTGKVSHAKFHTSRPTYTYCIYIACSKIFVLPFSCCFFFFGFF